MHHSAVFALVLLSGCAGFRRVPVPGPTDAPSSRLHEVWAHDHGFLVDDLRVDGDSMRGQLRSDKGTAGPFVIALAEVDSVRAIRPDGVDSGLTVGVLVALLYFLYARARAAD